MKTIEIFEKQYISNVPKEFIELPKELLLMKYPMEQRPQIVMTDNTYTTDIKFSLLDVNTMEKITEPLTASMKRMILDANTSYKYIEEGVIKDEKGNIASFFSFCNDVSDGIALNVIGYKQFGKRVINISLSCPFEKQEMGMEIYVETVKRTQRKLILV